MALTDTQQQALSVALRAEADAGVVQALSIGNAVFLEEWCNSASASDAWNARMDSADVFEATTIAKFDNLTAGKRDAWKLIIENAPIDCSRNKMRKAAEDIWGAADSVAVLQAMTRKATRGEAYIGGTLATTNTVTALKLNFSGYLSHTEISQSLNKYP